MKEGVFCVIVEEGVRELLWFQMKRKKVDFKFQLCMIMVDDGDK